MKSRKVGGFDGIAPIYDGLAKIVFGNSIRHAQLHFLREIPEASSVLILGGGTGWLLLALLRINPDCQVCYIEASHKMLESARDKISTLPKAKVHFIHGTEEVLPVHARYDAVIANFYFDLFSSPSLEMLVKDISKWISPAGKLLVSDFTDNQVWWQSALLSFMYLFFRLVCGIEAIRLPDWQHQLGSLDFVCKKSKGFYRNFIKSSVYEIRSSTNSI